MTVRHVPGLPRLVVHVTPVGDSQRDFSVGPVAALVLVVDPASWRQIDPALEAAESQVAVMLSEGKTPRDIAMKPRRQEGTVYILIKRAYKKLGISRQVDLVRLVLSLVDVSAFGR